VRGRAPTQGHTVRADKHLGVNEDDNTELVNVEGFVDQDGTFLPTEAGYSAARLAKHFANMRVMATFMAEKEYPRQKQKGLYWKYLVGALMGWSGYKKLEAHWVLRKASLSYEKNGEVFAKSTTELRTKDEWTDYIRDSIHFLTGIGCPVRLPEDGPDEQDRPARP
jgi:hypothetical protein